MPDSFNNDDQVGKFSDGKDLPDLPEDVFRFPSEKNPMPTSTGSSNRLDANLELDPIDKMQVPNSWNKEITEAQFGHNAKGVSFFPPDGQGAELALYDRGFPIARSEAQKFRDVLSKQPHVLSVGEIDLLGEQVLGTVGDKSAFAINQAQTRELNGKRVLEVEGNWKEGGKKFFGYFIPKDDSYREIQEVYFEADQRQFFQFRRDALNSIESINWKPSD